MADAPTSTTEEQTLLSFLVPAYGQATINFKEHVPSVPPSEIVNLNTLVRSLLSPSNQAKFDALKTAKGAGGMSLIGLLAQSPNVIQTMQSYGLTPTQQVSVLHALTALRNVTNVYSYKTTVDNTASSQSTYGNLIVYIVRVQMMGDAQASPARHVLLAPSYTVHCASDPVTPGSSTDGGSPLPPAAGGLGDPVSRPTVTVGTLY